MSEFKGTKAPWEARISQLGIDVIQQGTGFGIIDFGTNEDLRKADYSFEVAEANAKLISKAPEMLEMLETMKKELYWCINKLQEYGEEVDFQTIAEVNQLIKEATE